MAFQRLCCAIAALSAVLLSDLCVADQGKSSVLFFSDSDDLFRPARQDVSIPGISPRALVATTSALLGLPSPPGTDSACSNEVKELVAPHPFLHTPLLVLLVLRSASALPSAWAAPPTIGPQAHVLRLAQRRALAGLGVNSLKADLSAMHRQSHSLQVYPGAEKMHPELASLEDAKETWDAASLGNTTLGDLDSHSASFVLAAFGREGEEFLKNVVHLSSLIHSAASASAHAPALVAASLSLKGLEEEAEDEDSIAQALEAALALLGSTALKANQAQAQGPLAMVVLLDAASSGSGRHSDLALIQPAAAKEGDGDQAGQRRTLVGSAVAGSEEEAETPEETANRATYVAVWILLLAALLVGLSLMYSMPLTKDTLLYSGVKMD